MSQEFTFAQVKEHAAKKDLFMIVHDKVYDVTKFVDEHPGGEEVLLDVGGADATEAFEDVGHSDEAREILDGLLVGTLKRLPGDPPARAVAAAATSANVAPATGMGSVALYFIMLIGAGAAYAAYLYVQAQQKA